MEKKKEKSPYTLIGILVLIANILMAGQLTMSQSYANYAYTDLAGISASQMAACMTVVNVIAVIITLISGIIIQKSNSRFGKFRPWILFGVIVQMLGGYMLFISYPTKGTAMVLISCGYLLANSSMDFIFSAKNGLYSAMAGTNSDARTEIVARETQGKTIGMLIVSASLVSLVLYFGKNEPAQGYRTTQLIFTAAALIGAIMLIHVGKPYDKPIPKGKEAGPMPPQQTAASVPEMVKGVLTNRAALMLILGDICRLGGMYVFTGILVYQCTNVFGDMQYMTFIMIANSIAGLLGAFIGPGSAKKLKGRKTTLTLFSLLTGICYLLIIFFGKTFAGFLVCTVLANFFAGVINTVDVPMYMDAGEYWLNKTGKDTRVVIMSMFNVAMKIGIALSALIIAGILGATSYTQGVMFDSAQKSTMTVLIGVVLGVANLLPVLFLKFYPVADADIQGIIMDNAKKYGTAGGPGGPGGPGAPGRPADS